MFVSHPISPKTPKSGRRAPRNRAFATRYVYTEESKTPIKDVILSIVNGIGMEAVEPTLFPRLITPLNQEIPKLQRARNYSAIRQVDLALEFIQKYYEDSQQNEYAREQTSDDSEYVKKVEKIIRMAMNGQKLPDMSQKLKNDVIEELENISYREQNHLEGKLADDAIVRIQSPQRRSIRRHYERQNAPENVDVDEQIETIQNNLQKDLAKINIEKKNEINRLKISRDAQLNVVNAYIALNPPKDFFKPNPEVKEMKSEEHYLISIHRFSQAEKLRVKINALIEQNKAESELKWQNEVEKQRNAIETNYTEKYQMKIKYYRHKAQELRATAKKQISELNDPSIKTRSARRSPAKTLPKLKSMATSKPSAIRTSRR